MKKESAFKMKGFSGFGNSPVENNGILDTKFKDVPKTLKKSVKKVSKKASDAISNVKEKIGNTTVGDALAYPITSSPTYKVLKNLHTKITKKTGGGAKAGGVVSGAKKGLKERGLSHKRLVTKRKITNNTKMKAPYKRPVGPRAK